MFPIIHFITSLVLMVILYPFFGYWSGAVFIGGFFIDVDHYLWWVMDKRNFSLIKGYRNMAEEAKKNKERFSQIIERPLYLKLDRLHIFHVWEFWVLMLNTQNIIIGEHMVSKGILDASIVHPREVFKPAIRESASKVILVHNHPSGDCEPSDEDEKISGILIGAG